MRTTCWITAWAVGCFAAVGCDELGNPAARAENPLSPWPLPVQQARAYPEMQTGLFFPLADFEDRPEGRRGAEQARRFTVEPAGSGAVRQRVIHTSRTGVGSLEVTLPAGSDLIFRPASGADFSGYTLLTLSIRAAAHRDDLRVSLVSPGESWISPRRLIRPGWNTVHFDLRPLESVKGFSIQDVRAVRLRFDDAAGPVTFFVDDLILVNNTRELRATPVGMQLRKSGTDYEITVSSTGRAVRLAQFEDGLWRLSPDQAALLLSPPGREPGDRRQSLDLLGARRIGEAELLEANAVRVRLASTWYFPDRSGEWASLAVRRVRWEHTFYPDGRRVTHVKLNNAGGPEIGAAKIVCPRAVAWGDGQTGNALTSAGPTGPIAEWSWLAPPETSTGKTFQNSYVDPGRIEVDRGAALVASAGDEQQGGFDRSQGCYVVRAIKGRFRFRFVPPQEGVLNPVFRVEGNWSEPVCVSSEGLAIRRRALLADGSLLFLLPGEVSQSIWLEISGSMESAGK